jgi:hypothetical protein
MLRAAIVSSMRPIAIVLILLASYSAIAQQPEPAPAENPIIRVQLKSAAKVKVGSSVHAVTVQPLFDANQLVVPAGTLVNGKVIAITPIARDKRINAVSHGDFTPLKDARIQFDSLTIAGETFALDASPAEQGNDVMRFQSSGTPKSSLFSRLKANVTTQTNQTISVFTAPGKMDRLKKFVYMQLPYHPQAIDAGTEYDVALLAPLPNDQLEKLAEAKKTDSPEETGKPAKSQSKNQLSDAAVIHARLENDLSSKTAKQDDPVVALVTQPLLNKQGQIEVPQGSTLRGRVLRVQAAGKWGHNGALRFTFNQVDFPKGPPQQVAGVPTAMDGSKNGQLKLDAEGGVSPATNKGIMLPLTMAWLATNAMTDNDGIGAVKAGVSANGFGLITRVLAISTGSRYVGAAVGFAGTARVVYTRFISHGRDVNFARNTQVEVEVGPIHKLTTPVTQ